MRRHAGPNVILDRTEMSCGRTKMLHNQTTRTMVNWDQNQLDLCGGLSPCITITKWKMNILMQWNYDGAFVFIFQFCLFFYTAINELLYILSLCPGSNDRGQIVFVLSVCLFVCLSVVDFNLRYMFWTVRDRDFIFGMHTPQMMPF